VTATARVPSRLTRRAQETAEILREARRLPATESRPLAAPSGQPHVVIVGGGIAGLAAAHRLANAALDVHITLIERVPRLGGKILTEHVDGFIIEGGPDSFLAVKPRGVGLARELGLEARLIDAIPENRRSFVLYGGRLHDLPEGLTGLVPTKLGPLARSSLLSPLGKARLALDYALPPRREDDDETLAAFIERRLGREAYDRLVEPLMAGIYAGDGRQLSLAATFPQLRRAELDHGSLIKGVLAGRRGTASPLSRAPAEHPKEVGPGGRGNSPFLTLDQGLAVFVDTLVHRLSAAGVSFLPDCTVTALRRIGDAHYELTTADGQHRIADAVILATPAGPTADLLSRMAPTAARALRDIPYVSTAIVSLAYRTEVISRGLRGYGYVIPRVEKRRALACTWVSSKWPERTPDGYALLRIFIGRAGDPPVLDQSDDSLIAIARDELRDTLGVAAAPALTRVFRWPDGMPQYTLGHLDRVAAVERELAGLPGLFVAGHAYRGVGIPDCIASGETAAEAVLAGLAGGASVSS
jgi:oxygen-dependent protoporphyrinogen oxidase